MFKAQGEIRGHHSQGLLLCARHSWLSPQIRTPSRAAIRWREKHAGSQTFTHTQMPEASTDSHTFTHTHTDPSTAPHTHIHSHRHGFAQFPHRGRNPHPRTPSRPHTCTQTHSHTFMQVRTHSHTGSRTDPHTCRGIHTAEGGIKKGGAGACYVRGLHGCDPCKRPRQAYCTLTHTRN